VPQIAIKKGVIKNLAITCKRFQSCDSSKASAVCRVADSNNIQILVINIDFFVKDENIVNRPNGKLTGKQSIEFIQNVNPIVIS
jgi:type III restriction enzyme